MSIRFHNTLQSNKNSYNKATLNHDFVVRERMPIWQILGLLFISFAVVLYVLSWLAPSTAAFGKIIFIMCVGFGTYGVFYLQNSRDLALEAEFLNAIFSSALAHSSKFCIILRNDGTITYFNPALQELFPDFMKESRRSIDSFLEQAQVLKEQRKEVFSAFEENKPEKIIFDVVDSKKQSHRLLMSLEPLAKPSGFKLFCGHEFVEERSSANLLAANVAPSLFNRANFNLLSYVSESIGVGVYLADIAGNISYTNHVLEKALSYNDGEIATRSLPIKDLINKAEVEGEAPVIGLQNFEGEIDLQRKLGRSAHVFLNQKLMYDESGSLVGCVAFVHFLDEPKVEVSESKKNSW